MEYLIAWWVIKESRFWKGTFGKAEPLPGFAARNDTVSVIGFASGAFMASNLHTIFSESFAGAGLVSGGPYSIGTLCEDGCIDYEEKTENEFSDWSISVAKANANEDPMKQLI